MKTLLLMAAIALTAVPGNAQRLNESRVAFASARQTSPEPEREGRTASRILLGVLGGIVFGTPVALLAVVPHLSACEDRCDDSAASLVALGAAYFTGVAAGAALPPARACTGGKRFARAVIGALAGGAVAIGAITAANGHRGPAAAASVVVGVFAAPTGAALALRDCD